MYKVQLYIKAMLNAPRTCLRLTMIDGSRGRRRATSATCAGRPQYSVAARHRRTRGGFTPGESEAIEETEETILKT